jgi:hypothetical protein
MIRGEFGNSEFTDDRGDINSLTMRARARRKIRKEDSKSIIRLNSFNDSRIRYALAYVF